MGLKEGLERSRNMLKFVVLKRDTSRRVKIGEFTDVELDNMEKGFDTRLYDILPLHLWEKIKAGAPIALIKCFVSTKKHAYRERLIPIFSLGDLEDVYVTRSGYLVKKSLLTEEERVRMEAHLEGTKLFT